MLISHSHRFIFVHISKTAGTSLKRALAPYCNQPPRVGFRKILSHLPVRENPYKVAFRPHTTARWARMKLSPRVFDDYCCFSVVRNPFDRAVSNFHFVQQRPGHHTHAHVKNLTFGEYLDFLARRRWSHDPTQFARLVDGGDNLLCDPILRFENLETEFPILWRRLGLEGEPQLPKRNASVHAHYLEYYDDRATRDKLVDLFRADFDAFGYATVPGLTGRSIERRREDGADLPHALGGGRA
jgi:hypothetical protein